MEIGQASWQAGEAITVRLDGSDLTEIVSEDACELI